MNIKHMTVDEVINAELDVPASDFRRLVQLVREESFPDCSADAEETIEHLQGRVDELEVFKEVITPIVRSLKNHLSDKQLEILNLYGVKL